MKLTNIDIYHIIDEFVRINKYKKRDDVLGIFFYGGALYGNHTEGSDIDLHIITTSAKDIRGNIVLHNTHVEYFERPYNAILNQMQYEKETNQTVILSMLGYGKIIYEKNGALTKLQQTIKASYADYKPQVLISKKEAIFNFYKIYINMQRLEKLMNVDDDVFYYMYYIVLDNIKKFYEKMMGLSTDISQYKLKRFYLHNQEQVNTFKTIPANEFIQIFLQCVPMQPQEKMLHCMQQLFTFCTKDLDFDFTSNHIIMERK